eukprot:TRINITY_DN11568_c0_g1_i1.p1 TRINITY_DN11568_c0_g1~~TRINITY_DN11568_c0_g1_i1.p1  ORF type:complete len:102 (-),score=8.08 TRINITY_DN11568_c0_g1_i1:116-421(-)
MMDGHLIPECWCAISKKAKKSVINSGQPNAGKEFWTCSNYSCSFFEWVKTVTVEKPTTCIMILKETPKPYRSSQPIDIPQKRTPCKSPKDDFLIMDLYCAT